MIPDPSQRGKKFIPASGWKFCLFAVGMMAAASALAQGAMVLTNAAQVRHLSRTEAAKGLPVRLQGVVLGEALPAGTGFAIQEATGGIYVEFNKAAVAQLHLGDLIEIQGVSNPGMFAPYVKASEVRKMGQATIPEPRRVSFEEMAAGKVDAQWVEVTGIVRSCEPPANDPRKCMIQLATGGGRLAVRWNVPNMRTPMVDAEVRLRGVCYYLVNRNRQLLSPMLAIPHDVPVITEVPPPSDPFQSPVHAVNSLMQFTPEGSDGHRVHVRGIVIRQQLGESLCIRDGDQGLLVQSSQTNELQAGEEVDVLGFPKQGECSPMLEDAVFQKRSSERVPPVPLRLASAALAIDNDANLIELEATLIGREPVAGGWAFTLEAGNNNTRFDALLPALKGQPAPPDLLVGSRVRATGVCLVFGKRFGYVSGRAHPRGFQLLLSSPADLSVIQPPSWWNWQHVGWLLCGIAGGALFAIIVVVLVARLRLREQTANRIRAEAEFKVILGERNRVAREIHDILAQGLGAIALHLDLAKDEFHRMSQATAKHLEIALDQARSCIADASYAVWNLRSQVLESKDLPTALEWVLKQLTDGTNVTPCFNLTGQPRRLPPVTENAVLRIGQEAITNAVKHAQAAHIEVSLSFADNIVSLQVRDDGCGFDTNGPPPRRGGFGLVGLRERAGQLGGELKICSHADEGTEIDLTVSVASLTSS